MTLEEDYINLYKLQLRKIYTTLNTEREAHVQQYKLKAKELKERFINEEIKADLYEKFPAKYRKEREEMEGYMNMTTFSTSNLEKYISRSVEYLLELPAVWASSDYKEKQKLQFAIFPEGIYYCKQKHQPRTTKMNALFSWNAAQKGITEEKETGTSEVLFKNSGLVASPRIERGS
ncbi:MAG: hypothetical protein M3342_13175 [Bacteroidota bacterium]|nr:hypothetical protein [Bacteroidota bacterium]